MRREPNEYAEGFPLHGHKISPRVRQFVTDHVDSVIDLELLLALVERPGVGFSSRSMAEALRVDPSWADAELRRMAASGLLVTCGAASPSYMFLPRDAELDETVGELARVYAERRVTVISLIFSKPTARLRTFADAFRLRSGNGHDA